jgi:catecholate siderophore receptor
MIPATAKNYKPGKPMHRRHPARAPLAAALAAILFVHAAEAAGPAAEAALNASASSDASGTAASDDDTRIRKPAELEKVEVVGEQGIYNERSTRSATRTDTLLINVPQSVTIVNSQLIRDQRMQGMADVVRYVPGVQMAQGEGNRDTPILRGSSSTADMFIDGVRDDTQYFRDLYNTERVEALKGPNAMIFGRGGSGGVLNRVSKQADFATVRGFDLTAGSDSRGRAVADWGQSLGHSFAFRINALSEQTGSFRDGVDYSRRGFNPTLAWRGDDTTFNLGYERFEDERTADRGVPSFNGKPVDVDPSTFFGDPERSESTADVDAANLYLEHDFGNGLRLRNRTRAASYDKFYQNVFPGTAYANGQVQVSAYNNATQRDNAFNQTELEWQVDSGSWRHTLLTGAEFDRQVTDNLRHTGYFAPNKCPSTGSSTITSTCVPLADPRYTGAITWAASATDADNHGVARNAAVFVQDQVEFSPEWQAIVGLRYDHFQLELHNNRNDSDLALDDGMLSPRVGLVYKPVPEASFYGSFSVAYLPRSGEQLASLTATNAALEPEKYENLELGAKWQFSPELSATAAIYQLSRSNVAVVDPDDSTRLVVLPGDSQRVQGVELGLSGDIGERWHVMGGYAWQKGEITRDIRTSPATLLREGTELAQVPRHSFSLWNRVDLGQRWGAGLGLVARSKVYASTSNAVVLPGYVRADAAVFYSLTDTVALQLNVENLFDVRYYSSANSDNNISPGSPRAFSLGLNLDF